VRREVGSINRFLYSIAMLAPLPAGPGARHQPVEPQAAVLVPGRGGHRPQPGHGARRLDEPRHPGQGYAIVHSSGNNTGTHYNMTLAGETAMMTKERFVERYGVPLYTVGLGGSGGAIQQYLIAQNQPGVLDGLLPVQSYPDMVTQTIHVGDCELLEHYMDATDRANPKWRVTKNRSWLVGMNAEEGVGQRQGQRPPGAAEDRAGLQHRQGQHRMRAGLARPDAAGDEPAVRPGAEPAAVRTAERHRRHPLDALRRPAQRLRRRRRRRRAAHLGQRRRAVRPAVAEGRAITPAEFLHLNWHVGGWKHPSQMVQEGFPFFGTGRPRSTRR
jgi:hypothetical protein